MLRAAGKVIVVTGASAGLGRCLALEAGRRGANVAMLARRDSILQALENDIRSLGGEAHAVPTDIRDAQSVSDSFSEIESHWGRIDILINNAAVVEPLSPLVSCSDVDLLNSLKTNVYGVYLATREAIKRMDIQPMGGVVINITGGTGRHPYAGWSPYCSQKAAVDMFTQCVALEVADKPITVMAVCPGSFESHMQQVIRATNNSAFPARKKFVRLQKEGKFVDPKEAARIIIYISLVDWPELSGKVEDLRSEHFQRDCIKRGIIFRSEFQY